MKTREEILSIAIHQANEYATIIPNDNLRTEFIGIVKDRISEDYNDPYKDSYSIFRGVQIENVFHRLMQEKWIPKNYKEYISIKDIERR